MQKQFETLLKIIFLFLRPLSHLVYFLSGLFPRDKTVWAFGSAKGYRFADNAKWFFIYCASLSDSPIKPIWISKSRLLTADLREKGFTAFYAYSPMGLWRSLRAGVFIFDAYSPDINYWISRKAVKINMRHGSPLKKIERDISQKHNMYYKAHHGSFIQRFFYRIWAPFMTEKYDFMISASEYVKGIFVSAFNMEENKVWVTGYPRIDALMKSDYAVDHFRHERWYQKLSGMGKRIIFYLPTFRDKGASYNNVTKELFARLAPYLMKNNYVLVYKPHINTPPLDKSEIGDSIIILDNLVDIYPLLGISELLITDYSSVTFDYLLTDKKIIFFPYDLEDYLSDERELYSDYDEETPGPKATTLDELALMIEKATQNSGAKLAQNYESIKSKYNLYSDSKSSERLYGHITQSLDIT